MSYNNNMKKVTTKRAQIAKIEFKKAEAGKEFNVDIITQKRIKPEPPVIVTDGNGGSGGNGGSSDRTQNPKRSRYVTHAELNTALAPINSALKLIIDRLDAHWGKGQ